MRAVARVMQVFPEEDEMECPFCREKIKNGAILCMHCKSDLSGIVKEELIEAPIEEMGETERVVEEPKQNLSPNIKKKRKIWLLIIILILAAIAAAWFLLLPKSIKDTMKTKLGNVIPFGKEDSTSGQSAIDPFLIVDHKVGRLYPGISLRKLEKIWGNYRAYKSSYESGGDTEKINVVEIFMPGESEAVITSYLDENDNLGDLTIIDSRFHTKAGVSIDSVIGEIKKAYPDLRIEWHEGYDVWSEKAGFSFELMDRGNEIADESQIKAIILSVSKIKRSVSGHI